MKLIREHRIPTIIGFLVLVIGLAAGVFLVQQGQVFFLRAAPEITPKEVKITNVADSSFVVSFTTQKETIGAVKFGPTSSLETIAQDDRDQAGQAGSYFTHHVTLKNLKPQTRYFFKILSQGKLFDNSGKPYELTTARAAGSLPSSDLISGKVLTGDGQKGKDAIVYLSMANMTPQSALVGSDGAWFLPLSTAFAANLEGFVNYDKQAQVLEIFVQGSPSGTATAIVTTDNARPVPEITLGKTYDFRKKLPQGETTPILTPTTAPETQTATPASKFSFTEIKPPTLSEGEANLTITNPDQEGERINTTKPEFTGTGPVGKNIQILVESPLYTGSVKVGNDGSWNWIQPTGLAPGEHKITISYLGQSFSRTFTVLAAGESNLPAFTATPSATLTPTPTRALTTTPTPTPTRTTTLTPTPTPRTTLTPTPTPKVTLTPTPTATSSARTSMPATTSGVPSAGDLTPTFITSIIGLLLILSGFVVKKLLAHAR